MKAGLAKKAVEATFRPRRYRWWHALLFWAAVSLPSWVAFRPEEDERYYEEQEQAPFAPPSWVFGPAWAANNAAVLWGNLRLVNLPEGPDKKALLRLQGASWFLFSTFAYVAFRRRSPILGFVWTAAFWALTVASVIRSREADKKTTLSLVPLLAWLTFAVPVGAYQATHNPDELFGYDPGRR